MGISDIQLTSDFHHKCHRGVKGSSTEKKIIPWPWEPTNYVIRYVKKVPKSQKFKIVAGSHGCVRSISSWWYLLESNSLCFYIVLWKGINSRHYENRSTFYYLVQGGKEKGSILTLIWVGVGNFNPWWFSLNNSETVKAVTLVFWSIL